LEPGEDAPRRAAHAALAIQKEARRARESGTAALDVTTGLHVGALQIARIGPPIEIDATSKNMTWSVLAQTLQAGDAGQTLASAGAAAFVERRFELAPVTAEADGQEAAYQISGQKRWGLGLWAEMTPFVGRRDELELLRNRLTLAARGHGQVVAVIGEA